MLVLPLSIDQIFQLAADQGLKPKKWGAKPLKPYAGFDHTQRLRKHYACQLARAMNLMPPASQFPCDICGKTSTGTMGHSEDYSKMEVYPLCRSCHAILHGRFRHRHAWERLTSKFGDGTKWYEQLE